MPSGIIPARGPWEIRRSAITSLSGGAFQKGELVVLDHSRNMSLYSSVHSGYFGVALGASANSFPAGFQLVALPTPGCTAYVDLATNEAASGTSWGQAGSCVSAGGITSTFSLLAATSPSWFSRIFTIVGDVDSANSRVEVSFLQATATFYSVSSTTLNN